MYSHPSHQSVRFTIYLSFSFTIFIYGNPILGWMDKVQNGDGQTGWKKLVELHKLVLSPFMVIHVIPKISNYFIVIENKILYIDIHNGCHGSNIYHIPFNTCLIIIN